MRFTIRISLLALAITTLPVRAEIPLVTANIAFYAQLNRDDRTTRLQANQALDEGDTVRTSSGPVGAILHFADDGIVTLGGFSQLFIQGADPANLGRGEVLRAQLLRGEITLDAYPPAKVVPKDYRINVGSLKIRALGADMWAAINSGGEAVCLRKGALEIESLAGHQRLDINGDCLQQRNGKPLEILSDAEAELKSRMIVATPLRRWTIVMATAKTRAAAKIIAGKLAEQMFHTTIHETGSMPSSFNVTLGSFASAKEADKFAQQLQLKYLIKYVRVAVRS